MWVEGFEEGDFLGTVPTLDFLFAGNRGAGGRVGLEPDQFGAVVFLGKAGDEFLLVLVDASGELAGDAQIEDAGSAGHEVDVEGALHGGELYGLCKITNKINKCRAKEKEEKRDFSLRGPTALQEQSGEKKHRPAPFEMTVVMGSVGLVRSK